MSEASEDPQSVWDLPRVRALSVFKVDLLTIDSLNQAVENVFDVVKGQANTSTHSNSGQGQSGGGQTGSLGGHGKPKKETYSDFEYASLQVCTKKSR